MEIRGIAHAIWHVAWSLSRPLARRPRKKTTCHGDPYLVVATKNWWPGKKVLISPKWIESVSWDAREVVIEMTRETIKDAPEYTDKSLLTRDYETGLHGYYNREGYWVEELSAV